MFQGLDYIPKSFVPLLDPLYVTLYKWHRKGPHAYDKEKDLIYVTREKYQEIERERDCLYVAKIKRLV